MAAPQTFASLDQLTPPTLAALNDHFGFATMTPVQAASLPLMLTSKDVVAEAITGSGKTLAFAIAAVELVARTTTRGAAVVVAVAPTRELAGQTARVFAPLCAAHSLKEPAVCVGGGAVVEVTGHEVVVATPGRLDDLLERAALDASAVEFLVLDEADQLLDLGFRATLDRIMRRLPRQRRTALFSATQTRAVADLARAGLRNPASVRVRSAAAPAAPGGAAPVATPAGLRSELVVVRPEAKVAAALELLKDPTCRKALVFFDTCAAVDFFDKALAAAGVFEAAGLPRVTALHGKMVTKKRRAVWAKFRDETSRRAALLCTDVAARGLDVDDVDLVIQIDAPQKPETFLHRSGRTARAGRPGRAVAFLEAHEDAYGELLRLRGAPTSVVDAPATSPDDLRRRVEAACLRDRAVLEKGTRAFTAHVRSYLEHRLPYIFRWEKVDVASVARLYGLLKLPDMPELRKLAKKKGCRGKAWADAFGFERRDVRTGAIPYADASREAARGRRYEAEQVARREKRAEAAAAAAAAPKPKKKDDAPRKRKGLHEQIMDDWDDFAEDERRAKKARRKKVAEDDPDLVALDALDGGGAGGAAGPDRAAAARALQSRKNMRKQKGTAKKRHKAFAARRKKGK